MGMEMDSSHYAHFSAERRNQTDHNTIQQISAKYCKFNSFFINFSSFQHSFCMLIFEYYIEISC